VWLQLVFLIVLHFSTDTEVLSDNVVHMQFYTVSYLHSCPFTIAFSLVKWTALQ